MTHNNSYKIDIAHCWQLIQEGIQSRRSNYHTMTLGYLCDAQPRCIKIIPRKLCETNAIIHFHTDIRAQKINHLKKNPEVSCLFWCKHTKVQLSLTAIAKIRHQDQLTHSTWATMQQMAKICYCSDIPPNTMCEKQTSGFNSDTWENRHDIAETSKPYENFAIVQLMINSIERLQLSASGHNRIKFKRTPDKQWANQWLAP